MRNFIITLGIKPNIPSLPEYKNITEKNKIIYLYQARLKLIYVNIFLYICEYKSKAFIQNSTIPLFLFLFLSLSLFLSLFISLSFLSLSLSLSLSLLNIIDLLQYSLWMQLIRVTNYRMKRALKFFTPKFCLPFFYIFLCLLFYLLSN